MAEGFIYILCHVSLGAQTLTERQSLEWHGRHSLAQELQKLVIELLSHTDYGCSSSSAIPGSLQSNVVIIEVSDDNCRRGFHQEAKYF